MKTNPPMNESTAEMCSDLAGRLLELPGGKQGLRGGLEVEISEPPQEPAGATERPAVIDFIASSEKLDRYDEVLTASGWRLDNYRRNPVFQNAHQYGDIIFTLGKALVTEVRDGRLYQRVEFATAINPMARLAYGLYRGKFLNAVSVGFIPLRWVDGEAAADGGKIRRRYLEQELLEVSAVGIPANPEALQLGLKAGAVERSDLRELSELLRQMLAAQSSREKGEDLSGNPAAANTHARASGVRSDEAQLLQLARLARRLWKA